MIIKRWLDNFFYKHGFKLVPGVVDKTNTGKLWLIKDFTARLSDKIDPTYLFVLSSVAAIISAVLHYGFNVPQDSFIMLACLIVVVILPAWIMLWLLYLCLEIVLMIGVVIGKMSAKLLKIFFILSLILLAVPAYSQAENKTYHLCLRVIDGDTIVLEGNEKVRLIGIDTPETVHPNKPVEYFGKEASAFTKRMVEGKQVRLEYDWQKKDKYGRTLADVYLEDGAFLNLEIIRQGYGFAYTKYPFRFL